MNFQSPMIFFTDTSVMNHILQDEYVLEDLDIGLNILIQRVFKTNFAASWDEQGEDNQADETYSLTTVKSLTGTTLKYIFITSFSLNL